VTIDIPKEGATGENADKITVKGGKEDVAAAIAKIQEFVDDIARRVTQTVSIPREYHSSILGIHGANV